jgi:hypothetical protein
MVPMQITYIDRCSHVWMCFFCKSKENIFANVGWHIYFYLDGF